MPLLQQPLFSKDADLLYNVPFPSTRYQGSKRRLLNWIWSNLRELKFQTVLDVFGGTAAVSHFFKTAGKQVFYNDKLKFNWNIGLALVQNSGVALTEMDVETILGQHPGVCYPTFIQDTFGGIYFKDEENAWLDRVIYNTDQFITDPLRQALTRFAIFQACIIKRPYNLFHRANLYMREAKVQRSFGNKVTWDTPFETHFRAFVAEANKAVFDNGQKNQALHLDALETPVGADLVYLDPPYLNAKGIGVDYRDFYHFLEGLAAYSSWPEQVDYKSRHRRLLPEYSIWHKPDTIPGAFEAVIERHKQSILIISYRDDGIPSKGDLVDLLRGYKTQVVEANHSQKYVLSVKDSHELLLIAS